MFTACTSALQQEPVSLFFYSEEDIASASGNPSVPVERSIGGSSDEEQMTNAIRALLEGPSPKEMERGARTTEDLQNLLPFFQGVRIDRSSAHIKFDGDALTILNSAAARQQMAKAPLEKTLLQFRGIERVEYEIDGKVFTEWDA
jgi:spore germination protein GerM